MVLGNDLDFLGRKTNVRAQPPGFHLGGARMLDNPQSAALEYLWIHTGYPTSDQVPVQSPIPLHSQVLDNTRLHRLCEWRVILVQAMPDIVGTEAIGIC